MRKLMFAALGALIGVPSLTTKADYTITAVHTDLGAVNALTTGGNGTVPGLFQMIRFYAKNQGAAATIENQGSKLSIVGITMSDLGTGNLVVGGYNKPSGTPAAGDAADLFGQHEVTVVGGAYQYKQTLTTTTGAPKYVSFFNLLGDASVATDNNPNQTLNTIGPTPTNTFANYGYAIKSFSATYASTSASIGVNATTANGGLGALFAVAVVPFADSVNVQGSFGGDIGIAPTNYNFTTAVVPGDADLNGTVDLFDYTAVVQNFGTGTTWTQGNFNGTGNVDLFDYTTVVQNFGQSSQGAVPTLAASAVPEPASAILVLACTPAFLRRVRKNSSV